MSNCLICGAETEMGCIDLRQREPKADERPGRMYYEPDGEARYYCEAHREHMRNRTTYLDGRTVHKLWLVEGWWIEMWIDPDAPVEISTTILHDCNEFGPKVAHVDGTLQWHCPRCGSTLTIT